MTRAPTRRARRVKAHGLTPALVERLEALYRVRPLAKILELRWATKLEKLGLIEAHDKFSRAPFCFLTAEGVACCADLFEPEGAAPAPPPEPARCATCREELGPEDEDDEAGRCAGCALAAIENDPAFCGECSASPCACEAADV